MAIDQLTEMDQDPYWAAQQAARETALALRRRRRIRAAIVTATVATVVGLAIATVLLLLG